MDNGGALSQTSFSNLWDMVRRRTVDNPNDLGTPARNSKIVRSLDFHVTPHQLRHTYITRLFESGLDIKEIQYLAGHTTIDMTLRVYTHYQHPVIFAILYGDVLIAFGAKTPVDVHGV